MAHSSRAELTTYLGRAGDRNPFATAGSAVLGRALAEQLGLDERIVGEPTAPLNVKWDGELAAAHPELSALSATYDRLLTAKRVPLSVMGRCAAGIATIPVVARHRPDACVVWFDAHGDCNTPTSVPNPYLGGMVISGAAGMWDTGFGGGLKLTNVVLVGSRDLDPDEMALIESGAPALVRVGAHLPGRLSETIAGRPVYVHLDCDVLEPGLVPTEYLSPNGLQFEDLRAACEVLVQHDVVGFEIAEFQTKRDETEPDASPDGLLEALVPLLEAFRESTSDRAGIGRGPH
jgi:arginase